MDPKTRKIVIFVLIGIVAGWLASFIVQGGGLLQYLLSGVIGAFVGGYLLDVTGINLGIKNPIVAQILTATIGAIVVVIVARIIS